MVGIPLAQCNNGNNKKTMLLDLVDLQLLIKAL
jgi:hypothetical protein